MKKEGIIAILVVALVGFLGVVTADPMNWTGTETQFSSIGIGCSSGVNVASWFEINSGGGSYNWAIVFNQSGNVGDCSLYTDLTNMTCCPTGYSCDVTTGICQQEKADLCESFKNEVSCLSYTNEGFLTVKNFFPDSYLDLCSYSSLETWDKDGYTCQNKSKCACEWSNNACSATSQNIIACADKFGNYTEEVIGSCLYTLVSEENKCDTLGKIIVTYTATKSASSQPSFTCSTPKIIEYDCSAVVVVPFFTFANFIVSIMGIGLIYTIFLRKK